MNCTPYLSWLVLAGFVSGVGVGVALVGLVDWLARRRVVPRV